VGKEIVLALSVDCCILVAVPCDCMGDKKIKRKNGTATAELFCGSCRGEVMVAQDGVAPRAGAAQNAGVAVEAAL